MRWVMLIVAALSVGASWGCEPEPAGRTPEGAVRAFVETASAPSLAPGGAKLLYDLLSRRARANLDDRARRYGAASGKEMAPWAMIVPSRMSPRFVAQTYSAEVVGNFSRVEIEGVGAAQRAQVSCVLEDGLWRLDLLFPELPPLEHRSGAEP